MKLLNFSVIFLITVELCASVYIDYVTIRGLSTRTSKSFWSSLEDLLFSRLNFVDRAIGAIECKEVDSVTQGNFFKHVLGPYTDFGGDYLCQPTCGGLCVQNLPNANINVAQGYDYPFGCKCPAHRCGPNGPITKNFASPNFKMACVKDTRCTCKGLERTEYGNFVPHTGYLCNWINVHINEPVSYTESSETFHKVNPSFSPVSWCSCCPSDNSPTAPVYLQNKKPKWG